MSKLKSSSRNLASLLSIVILLFTECSEKALKVVPIDELIVDSTLLIFNSNGEQFMTYMNDSTIFTYERDQALIREYSTHSDTILIKKEVELDPTFWMLNPTFLEKNTYHKMICEVDQQVWQYKDGNHKPTGKYVLNPDIPGFRLNIFYNHDLIRIGDTCIIGRMFDWETRDEYFAGLNQPPYSMFRMEEDNYNYIAGIGQNFPEVERLKKPWQGYVFDSDNNQIVYFYDMIDSLYFLDIATEQTTSMPLNNDKYFSNNEIYAQESKEEDAEEAEYGFLIQHPISKNYLLTFRKAHGPKERRLYGGLVLDPDFNVLYEVDMKKLYLAFQGQIYYHPSKVITMISDLSKPIEWKNETFFYTLDY